MSSLHKRLIKARFIHNAQLSQIEEQDRIYTGERIVPTPLSVITKEDEVLNASYDNVEMETLDHDMLKDTQFGKPVLIQIVDSSVVDCVTELNLEFDTIGPIIPILGGYNNYELQKYISSALVCDCRLDTPIFVLIRLHGMDNEYITRDSRGRAFSYSKSMLLDVILQSLVKFGYKDIHILDNSCVSGTDTIRAKNDTKWLSRGEAILPNDCTCKKGVTRYRFADINGSAWETGTLFNRDLLATTLLKICYLHMRPYCLRCMIKHNYANIEKYHNTRVTMFSTGLNEFHELLRYDVDYDDIEIVGVEGREYDGVNDTNLYDGIDKPRFPEVVRVAGAKQVICLGGIHDLV